MFHDAWPTDWPRLIVDIVNNHHSDYYQAPEGDNKHPPGDWEDPIPVYFLAVRAGQTFEFALAKRRADVPEECLGLATQWLQDALCHLGAGAKTAAGYGAFRLEAAEAPALPPTRKEFRATLELVTPAFLAGASQQEQDCDLRPATLRGLLRWWWRTMHSGFVDVATLRRMEAIVWGDTKQGGAIRIELCHDSRIEPRVYKKRDWAEMRPDEKNTEYGIPDHDPKKTTQGLLYVSYGMDDKGTPRWFLSPRSSWKLRIQISHGVSGVSDDLLLAQATAALWLFSEYGGAGSKSRKGFGSLRASALDAFSIERCRDAASSLRSALGVDGAFRDDHAESPSLEQRLPQVTADFTWPDVWEVLDQVGFAYQACAKVYKHRREKQALGMPRRTDRGAQGSFRPTGAFGAAYDSAKNRENVRHASPIHVHLAKRNGAFQVRVLALPACGLPDLKTSKSFLRTFLEQFEKELNRRSGLRPRNARARSAPPSAVSASHANPPEKTAQRSTGVRVTAIGAHEKLKGAYWVHEPGKKKGLVKYGNAPDPLPAQGAEITVYPTNQSVNSPEYSWTPPKPSAGPPRGPRGGGPPRGRR